MAGASALSLVVLAGVGAAAVPVSDGEMRAATDRLLVEVGAVRRLAPVGTLDRRVETRVQARARRAAEVGAAAADPELAARVRLWERLGLVAAGADAAGLLAPTLDATPTASYDALGRRLAVPDWMPLPEQRPALAHALAHALADQRFGLRDFLGIDLEGHHHLDGDAERARLALVEGDATLTALELDDPRGAVTSGHALPSLAAAVGAASGPGVSPSWMRANASFAHGEGLAFVARVRARRPWSAVDALWAAPPLSSEQVLHPAKYDAHEVPVALPPPAPQVFGDEWREAGSDVLGELGVRTWLAAAVPAVVAERAAAGWGGDRATLFVSAVAPDAGPSPPSFVVWSTVWDDVTDAEDFARAAASALALLADAPADAPEDPHHFVTPGPDGTFALTWRGAAVVMLVGAPPSALGALDALLPKVPARPLTKAPTKPPTKPPTKAPTKPPTKRGPSPRPSPAGGRGSR